MSPDQYFRKSVIDAGIEIRRHLTKYPDITPHDAVRQLRQGSSITAALNYDSALEIAEKVGLDSFVCYNDRCKELRETILNLAMRSRPFWARVSVYGRAKSASIMDDNQKQCLESASLLFGHVDKEIVEWWDTLASGMRSCMDEHKLELGRLAEQMTLDREHKRLKSLGRIDLQPVWTAIEDNTAGFDIKSYAVDRTVGVSPLFIEVKALGHGSDRFVLTRREWDTAQANADNYIFHIWNVEKSILWELPVSRLELHVPTDHGHGYWSEVHLARVICDLA